MDIKSIIASCNSVAEIISEQLGGKSGTEPIYEVKIGTSPLEFLFEIGYKEGGENLLVLYKNDEPDIFAIIDAHSDLLKYISSVNMTSAKIIESEKKVDAILSRMKAESFAVNYNKYMNELNVFLLDSMVEDPSERKLQLGDNFDRELDFSKLFR